MLCCFLQIHSFSYPATILVSTLPRHSWPRLKLWWVLHWHHPDILWNTTLIWVVILIGWNKFPTHVGVWWPFSRSWKGNWPLVYVLSRRRFCPFFDAEFYDQNTLPQKEIIQFLVYMYTICKLVNSNSTNFLYIPCTFKNTVKFVETLFGELITQKRPFPLEFNHGSGTTCILPDKKKGVNLTL